MAQDEHNTNNRQPRARGAEPPAADHSPDHSKERKVEYLTSRQLADVLQISEATVHRLRRAGRIPAVQLTDRLIRFSLKDVQKALRPTHASIAADDYPEADEPSPQLSFEDVFSEFKSE